jgi:hypothetical protein
MAKAGNGRAVRWFNTGASLLGALAPGMKISPDESGLRSQLASGQWYMCPLCMSLYTVDEIDTNGLTVEHVPPRSIGGRPLVLTCRPCNNGAGHRLDAHLERRERLRRFGGPGALGESLEVTLTIAGIVNRGSMRLDADRRVLLTGNPKQNNPADVAELSRRLPELMTPGREINVEFRDTFDSESAQLSLVRAGYLAAFALFGYAYILRPEFDRIRAAIAQRHDDTFDPPVVRLESVDDDFRRIAIATKPASLAGHVVICIGRYGVVLPPVPLPGAPSYGTETWKPPVDKGLKFTSNQTWEWPVGPMHAFDRWVVAGHSQASSTEA